jgi:hypothetical protein
MNRAFSWLRNFPNFLDLLLEVGAGRPIYRDSSDLILQPQGQKGFPANQTYSHSWGGQEGRQKIEP